MARIGVISDTHGLLRPDAIEFLRGSDFIVHGGDIGHPGILENLRSMSPVTAVRGNNDKGQWVASIAHTQRLQVEGIVIYVLHDISGLDIDPAAAGIRVVVSGHSHKPKVHEQGGVLYVNPGSAGPRRFRLPVAVAEIIVVGTTVHARVEELDKGVRASKM